MHEQRSDGRHERRRRSPGDTPRSRGRIAAVVAGMLMLAVLPIVASQAGAALPTTPVPTFTTQNDENGKDDQPGQKDLNVQGVATPAPGDLWAMWQWDDTSLSGGNTGDACALFDTDSDAKVNFAVCVTIHGNPAAQAPVSPRVYTCGDGKVDRCSSTSTQVTPINSACSVTSNVATDPFHNGQKDTQAICHIDLADVGGATTAKLINTCSYPSQSPTSDASDCVLIPRDAFVTISKIATPNAGVFPFRLGTGTAATNPVVFTANGTQTSDPIAVRSGVTLALKEDTPANWAIDTPAPSCTGASGSNTSNGTTSGDTISGIKLASDNVLTCTYRNKQLTGAIKIVKVKSGTTTGLSGAHFQVDGAGDYVTDANGVACVAGLTLGSHTVTETQSPNGYSLPVTTTQTKDVANAGTCPSNQSLTATFEDALVPGSLTITKTGIGGAALEGAQFTLYNDNGTIGAPRESTAIDTVTNPLLRCTTGPAGTCTISNIPLGEYWIVETAAPNGYTVAADRHMTIDRGTTPGNGDSETRTITDSAAPGTVVIHKVGRGLPLAGAKFELYTRNPLETSHSVGTGTGMTCISGSDGDCTIANVPLGDYWIVEIITPAGYATVDDLPITVGLGPTPDTGDTVERTITDPTVPGSVVINKTGLGGAALNDATFSLYVDTDPSGATRTGSDPLTSPLKSCTTAGAGTCTISGVPLGDYWLVETTVPNGYNAAPEKKVHVDLGPSANTGDTDTFNLSDPVVNGTVHITKRDDANNLLAGAVFELYNDAGTIAGTRESTAIDTPTGLTCTTSGGTCDIANVPPGTYWIVETSAPNSHYDKAADRAITVGLGSAPGVGDSVSRSFVDERKHRVVVIVCHEGTDTLFSRDVTVNGVTKQSVAKGSLTDAQEKALCDTGGASFGDISGHGHVNPDVDLGLVTP